MAADIYRSQIERLKHSNPTLHVTCDETILSNLRLPNTRISSVSANGVVQVEKCMTVTREMPVHDERARLLARSLGFHLKKLHEKYPKLRDQLDPQLQDFINTDLSDSLYG